MDYSLDISVTHERLYSDRFEAPRYALDTLSLMILQLKTLQLIRPQFHPARSVFITIILSVLFLP